MKEFSDYEKLLIKKLIQIDATPGGLNVLGNIIDFELFPRFSIELNSETDTPVKISREYVTHLANTFGPTGLSEEIKVFNNKLLFIVRLFQYLEREGQIYLSGDLPLKNLGSRFDSSKEFVGYELEDKEVVSLLYHLGRKNIVVTDSLKNFVKNGFKTDQQLKQERDQENFERQQKQIERQTRLTAIGIFLSLILGLLGGIPNFVTMFDDEQPLTIQTVCCDSLIVDLSLDTLNVNIVSFQDTLITGPRTIKRKNTGPLKVEVVKFYDSLKIIK
jgi:hypothetical protein